MAAQRRNNRNRTWSFELRGSLSAHDESRGTTAKAPPSGVRTIAILGTALSLTLGVVGNLERVLGAGSAALRFLSGQP